MNTMKEISTGISYKQWYIDYECEQCKKNNWESNTVNSRKQQIEGINEY